ncbi:hypothetical protein BC834DRAFT_240711 [Gloeopeniophorella convolvens]|nr:hypothetical protein BC834DRAFT_240711 [Gloeopeniophorella convolvens]
MCRQLSKSASLALIYTPLPTHPGHQCINLDIWSFEQGLRHLLLPPGPAAELVFVPELMWLRVEVPGWQRFDGLKPMEETFLPALRARRELLGRPLERLSLLATDYDSLKDDALAALQGVVESAEVELSRRSVVVKLTRWEFTDRSVRQVETSR